MATRRPAGRSYDPVATRRALTEAALELFGDQGFHATSVQQVADRAGVTKGALYHHFTSKGALLRQIHDDYVDHQLELAEAAVASHDDPAGQLRALVRVMVSSAETYRSNVTVFFQERRYLTSDDRRAVERKRDRLDGHFHAVVARGVAAGAFRPDLDARVATLGILGMCAWAHQWFDPRGAATADEVADTFAALVLDGLVAR